MRLTNCNILIWNLKCRSLITTTNYLNYFKVVTTLLQGGKRCKSMVFSSLWQPCNKQGCYKLVISVWVMITSYKQLSNHP